MAAVVVVAVCGAASWTPLGGFLDGQAPGDEFGHSMAMSANGSRVVIGAISGATNYGRVRVYEYDGSSWDQIGDEIDGSSGSQFGYSVAMSADGMRIAAGAPYAGGMNGAQMGYVNVYEYEHPFWNSIGHIPGDSGYDYSGWSVAMSSSGTRIAIGAPYNDGNGSSSGHVRVYDYNGGTRGL